MKNVFLLFLLVTSIGIAQVPTITSISPSSGPVGTLVTISGTNLNNPSAFTIGGIGAIKISSTNTTLVGMVMPGASNGAISITTSGGTALSPGSFTVTSTPYPSVKQGDKLVGSGIIGQSRQGSSLALSADGNTAIVGGYSDNVNQGAAWIYVRNGNTWTQQGGKLVGLGGSSNATQGSSVAISADGNTVIIGGPADYPFGAAWIFVRNGSNWTQQGAKLVGTGTINTPNLGKSVALSADGNTAIIGGPGDNSNRGAIWVFTRSGSSWSQQGNKIVALDISVNSGLGESIAISANGNTAIAGGSGDNSLKGAAWVFIRNGSNWTQQGLKLVGSNSIGGSLQGKGVAISANGNTAIVGGRGDNTYQGAAWIYTRSGSTWSQQGSKLVGSGATGSASQGNSVSISADGNTAIVGGFIDNNNQGAAWVYTRTANSWSQQGSKLVGTGNINAAQQGTSVALSANGNTALVGGVDDNASRGAAWVFIPCTTPTSYLVTGGGSYCQGGSGVSIGLSNSEVGVSYQLQYSINANFTFNSGSPIAGTGSAISFGNQTIAGNYIVTAKRGNCINTMQGVVPVTVIPLFNPGTVTSADQTFCNSPGNPAPITLSANPTGGSGLYTWRWYYKENTSGACPTGTTTPDASWLTNNTSTNITGTFPIPSSSISFDPISSGTIANGGRTFAVRITPIQNGSTPACGLPTWASGCRKTYTVVCREGEEVIEEQKMDETIPTMELLGQCVPNPLNESAFINCFIPESNSNGVIVIQSIDGKVIQQLPVSGKGANQVQINKGNLSSGIYFYSLFLDGKQSGVKKMVITN